MSVRTADSGRVAVKERLRHRKLKADEHAHPVNVVHHDEASLGERLADGIASFIGSWRFLIIQTLIVATWVVMNSLEITGKIHIDPYPYILLNLAFSTQAAYTGPVLLLAGNRQAQKDRLTLEHAASEADKADQQNIDILRAIQHDTDLTERNIELALQIVQHLQVQLEQHIASTPGDAGAIAERETSARA
jgi:uncharacterized membrane protein